MRISTCTDSALFLTSNVFSIRWPRIINYCWCSSMSTSVFLIREGVLVYVRLTPVIVGTLSFFCLSSRRRIFLEHIDVHRNIYHTTCVILCVCLFAAACMSSHAYCVYLSADHCTYPQALSLARVIEKGVTRHLACCSLLGVVNLEEIVSAGPHSCLSHQPVLLQTHFGSTSSYRCDLQVRVVELEASLELPMVAEPVC